MRKNNRALLRRSLISICVLALATTAWAGQTAFSSAATYAGLVMDAKTGKVLYSHRGDATHYPASLTKMMTLYLMFEALDAGHMTKNTPIRFSKHSSSMQPSKLGIKPGGSITAEQAILALVTKSANDVAAAVAEHIGGTESGFAVIMTRKAHQLGMKSTTFKNASGLPNSAQVTTARDMALLGIALREHYPQYYHYFSRRSFTYSGRRMGNHNRLLGTVKGVDGIKTGYTRASGFNLVSSVEANGRSIVAVVLGGRTGKSRNAQMVKLIDRYLSKGSKGEDRMIVARPGSSMVAVADLELPKAGPLPAYRNGGIDPASLRVATAHVISTGAMPTPAPDRWNASISAIEAKLREMGSRRLPVPAPSPDAQIAYADPVSTASVAAIPVRVAKKTPASMQAKLAVERSVPSEAPHVMAYAAEPPEPAKPAHRSGWQVQISAVDKREAAIDMLEGARAKFPSLLRAYDNYTESVEKNGVVLYRARFAGFDSKSQAWDTCNRLKKNKIACLAIEN